MKKQIGKNNALYPSLTTILGTTVNGRPNFITIAHVGIMNHGDPQYISFGVSKSHYSNQGLIENKVFSEGYRALFFPICFFISCLSLM
jgi:flavin reductase (DIM6/NTAB) family NADH-FMN oxidoreductase RutF